MLSRKPQSAELAVSLPDLEKGVAFKPTVVPVRGIETLMLGILPI